MMKKVVAIIFSDLHINNWSENRYGGGSSGNCISVNLANGDHNSWTDDDYAYSVRCIFGSLY